MANGAPKKKLWLTYGWVDNEAADVDFIVQELTNAGFDVQIDREQLVIGRRLWDQIGQHIQDPNQADAWALVVSKQSLESEPCREELAIALHRALRSRGDTFPLIGIFLEPIDSVLVPVALLTRLYVNLHDANWAARVAAGVAGQTPTINRPQVPPYESTIHSVPPHTVVELRPRSGRWYPCVFGLPKDEQDRYSSSCLAPTGVPPSLYLATNLAKGVHGPYWICRIVQEANPSTSLFIQFSREPSLLIAGSEEKQFLIWGTLSSS